MVPFFSFSPLNLYIVKHPELQVNQPNLSAPGCSWGRRLVIAKTRIRGTLQHPSHRYKVPLFSPVPRKTGNPSSLSSPQFSINQAVHSPGSTSWLKPAQRSSLTHCLHSQEHGLKCLASAACTVAVTQHPHAQAAFQA